MRRHAMQVLRAAGMPTGQVAARTGTSARSVQRITGAAGAGAASAPTRRVGRPSTAEAVRSLIEGWLQETPGLPGVEVLRLAHEHGYGGGKSAVYELLRRVRPVAVAPLVRFEGVPGEFSQHDFGEIEVHYRSGRRERLRFFASRLKWSRVAHVVLVPDEREEALVRALLAGFEAFGGVPLVTVWDNPKTVVVTRQRDLIVWNPIFGQVALDYRFAPELCWPRSGQQKGAVENLVGWVKRSFFACRRFEDRADVAAQLVAWLHAGNTERPNRATGVIPAVRLREEQVRLRPLPVPAAAYALKIPVTVSPRARVTHDGRTYTMPPTTLGQAATLLLYPDHVEIVTTTGEVVLHPGRLGPGELSAQPAHRAAMRDAVRGVRARLYYQRQTLWELGPAAEAFLTELIHRRPHTWGPDVEQCFDLLQIHDEPRVLQAFTTALRRQTIGAEYVAALLAPRRAAADGRA